MPLLNKQPFIPRAPPNALPRDTLVYHCEPTGEVFLNHEEYFKRMILLNTTSWSCSLTRKTNLTYFEAVASEQEAERELVDFPDALEVPILYIVHRLTNRGRFEELVNDVYHILRDRFFNNEVLSYMEKSRKTLARVVTSFAIQQGILDENGMEIEEGTRVASHLKEPMMQAADDFRYTVEILEGVGEERGDDKYRENVKHDKLFRSKTYGSRQKIRLFLKTSCHLPADADRYRVREQFMLKIENVWWSDVMSGAEPVCPQTPVQQRGRIPNIMKPGVEGDEARERKQRKEDRDPNAPPRPRGRPPKTPEQRALAQKEKKEKRKRSEAAPPPPSHFDFHQQPDDFDLTSSGALTLSMVPSTSSTDTATNGSAPPAKKKIRRSSTSTAKSEKKKAAKIQEQQDDLDFYFNEARRLGIDVTGLEQQEKFLSPKKVMEFKQRVKEEKDAERELLKEEKKRKMRERAAYNKKREDLICNDLRPLPRFPSLELPQWMSSEEFGDYLFILQFFTSFKEILPLKEVRGSDEIAFSDIVTAMKCFDPQNSPFADLMKVLLSIRTDIADEEDGDEADIQNREEAYLMNAQNCDPVNVQWGDVIREISETHFRIRKIHGKSVRHLPVDWMTLTEVLRLIFLTSGYYTGISTHRHRLYARGNFRGYEDPAFELCTRRPDIMEKLRTQTVFDLEPAERLEITKALIYQLLTYSKFRAHMERQQTELVELKKEQKRLKAWDVAQEGEATAARLLLELGTSTEATTTLVTSPNVAAKKFKASIKAINEGRRFDKEEFDAILLNSIPYTQLTLDEIVTARDLQKTEFKSLMDSITTRLFSTYCKVSDIRLGSDRAYRRYLVMDQLSAILVETPTSSELRIQCDEASHIDDLSNLEDSDEVQVFVCSGDTETCKIHGAARDEEDTGSRWCYIRSRAQLDHLTRSLNARGHREVELLDELQGFRGNLLKILEQTEASHSDGTWKTMLMSEDADPADTYNIDWDTEIRDLLLDFEEKLDQGQMGSVEKTFGVERATWRQNLKEQGDVTMLLGEFLTAVEEEEEGEDVMEPPKMKKTTRSVRVFHGCSVELDDELSDAKKLAIAFWMIVRSIQMKFIKPPHLSPNKDEHGNLKPSEMFVRWQRGLLQCDSHSSLSLFISTFEGSIKWDKSRLQGKCRSCRRKAAAHDLILCSECDNCYHLKCAKLGQHAAPPDWKCATCRAQQRKLENEAKRAAASAATRPIQQHLYDAEPDSQASQDITLNNMSIQDSDDVEDPTSSSKMSSGRVSSHQETIRTSSGRAVKKVQYHEVHEGTAGLKSSRKSNGFGGSGSAASGTPAAERPHRAVQMRIYDDSENDIHDSDYSDGENSSSRRRKTPSSKKSLPSSSTSSVSASTTTTGSLDSPRGHGGVAPPTTTTTNKEKMSAIEALLKETMRQECSWPFLQPVDKKEVPDYLDVIKRPMDLRTMVNKIKQRVYNKPSEIRSDFQLILTNCETYNETESEIFQLSRQLEDFASARLDAIIEQ